jgi:predicted P-loop ATPase
MDAEFDADRHPVADSTASVGSDVGLGAGSGADQQPVSLADLARLPRWVAWRNEWRKRAGEEGPGQLSKIPYSPKGSRKAEADNPETWGDRAEAEARRDRLDKPEGGGVGIELGAIEGDPLALAGIDLDSCRNGESGALEPWAAEVIDRFASYAEVSPSGEGVKIFFRFTADDLPTLRKAMGKTQQHGRTWKRGKGKHPPAIELHLGNRYFTVTEKHLPETPRDLRAVDTATLLWLIKEAGPAFVEERKPATPEDFGDSLLQRLRQKMARSPKLATRWEGGTDGLKDSSRSGMDMSMMSLLKRAGFTLEECKSLLIRWPHGAGAERAGDARYFDRMWTATGLGGDTTNADQPWAGELDIAEGGRPAATEDNVRTVLETDTRWAGVLGFDEFASTMVFCQPPPWIKGDRREGWKPRPILEHDCIEIAMWMQRETRMMLTVPKAINAIVAVCRAHSFHPVREYLDGLQWDGTPRIRRWLADYVGAEDNTYHSEVGARWLIGATARIYRPGCKMDTALVLEGPQALRKSTAAAVLAGAWFTDTPQDLGTKDAMEELQGVWIIELAELTALGKAGTDRIKAFLSSGTDRFRPSYGRTVQAHPRQCAFIGTVNPEGGYLKDPTGGRRFWAVRCGARIDVDALRRDRDQLWAEAAHAFKAGQPWWLDSVALEVLAVEQQEERFAEDARDPLIARWIAGKRSVSVGEVIAGAFGIIDPGKWDQRAQNLVARHLIRHGWTRKRTGGRADREWRYFPPDELGESVSPFAPPTGTPTGTPESLGLPSGVPVSQCPSMGLIHKAREWIGGGADSFRDRAPPNPCGPSTADKFGEVLSTGTPGHASPCTRLGCSGRWVETQQDQRICRCRDPHCMRDGLVVRVSQCPA